MVLSTYLLLYLFWLMLPENSPRTCFDLALFATEKVSCFSYSRNSFYWKLFHSSSFLILDWFPQQMVASSHIGALENRFLPWLDLRVYQFIYWLHRNLLLFYSVFPFYFRSSTFLVFYPGSVVESQVFSLVFRLVALRNQTDFQLTQDSSEIFFDYFVSMKKILTDKKIKTYDLRSVLN